MSEQWFEAEAFLNLMLVKDNSIWSTDLGESPVTAHRLNPTCRIP